MMKYDNHIRLLSALNKEFAKSIRPRLVLKNKIMAMVLLLFAFLMIPAVSSNAQAASNPSNYWKLDESFGSTFFDSEGGLHASCTFPNCPQFSAGMIGNGQIFDGINDGLNVSPGPSFNWGNAGSFSIELWMKTDPGSTCAGNQVIVGRDEGSTNLHWWVGCKNGGQAAFYLYDKSGVGLGIAGTKDLTNGSWHHITAVRDAGTGEIRMYVDGVNEGSYLIDFADGFDSSGAALNIGWLNLGGGYHFQGVVDEVALYNRALSEIEIRSHYYISRGYGEMCAAPISIMPLGDSITYGYSVRMLDSNYTVGYRQKLFLDLINGGYDVNFAGSLSSGMLAQPAFDFNHEGHGGWCAEGCYPPYNDIVDLVYDFLVNNPVEVVLLHIGTNDIDAGIQDANAVGRILDEIDRYSKDVTVVLARIINRTDGKVAQTTQFNNDVEAMALNRIGNGDKIIIVDQESALNYIDDMDDPLHPNMAGYNKMAGAWLLSLNRFLPACVPAGPKIISIANTNARVGSLYTYGVQATGSPAPIYRLLGTPPSGMTINGSTGVIQWTPNEVGAFDVTVESANALGVSTQSFTVTVVNSVQVWLEAERGSLSAPMIAASNAVASSGQYVQVPNGSGNLTDPLQAGGTVSHTFTLPVAGNYVVWGRVMVDNSGQGIDDSFFVSMDSGSYSLWDTLSGASAVWGWDQVHNRGGADPVLYSLGAGEHTLVIKQREDGTKLDRILITNDMAYVPQGQGEVVSSAPLITSAAVMSATVGQVYSYDVNATGTPAPTYRLLTAPSGMVIDQGTGFIQWTPAAAGSFDVIVEASNTAGVDTQSFAVTVSPAGNAVKVWLEAERGSLSAPMVAASNTEASSGQYVQVPNGSGNLTDPSQAGGTVSHTFTLPAAGNYVVWGRVMVDSSGKGIDDSFFVSMDSGSYSLWDTLSGPLAVWGWDLVNNRGGADPVVYSLGAGQHTLVIKQREDGTKLDRILVTNDLAYVPQGQGEAVTSAPVITSTPVTSAAVGQPYTYDVNATGNPAPTYTLMVYPAGMTIDGSTGVIQWTPTVAGQFDVTVEASNTQGVNNQSFVVTVNQVVSSVKVWLEAESVSMVAPMVAGSDGTASSGQYVWVPNGSGNLMDPSQAGGSISYVFNVPVSGNYVVWGRVMVDNSGQGNDDSFFVSMDSGSYSLWDTLSGVSAVWGWDLVNNRGGADPVVYALSAGQHTLVIKQREDGTKLDRILITNDMAYVPQGQGETVSSAPVITSMPVISGAVGQLYAYDVNATGNPAPTYTLMVYPAGMTIDGSTGVIQWTPTVAGQFDVTVEASNTQGVNNQSFVVTVNQVVSSVKVWLEAESVSMVAPMVAGSDGTASSGQYVWVPNGSGNLMDPSQAGGSISYVFNVPEAGNYVVWGRVMVDNSGQGNDDSFFVSMDSGPYSLWDTLSGPLAVWGWDLVNNRGGADPVVYTLTAGTHTLKIKQREDGTKLDRILVTNELAYVPQGQ